jgi:hypothetical protein
MDSEHTFTWVGNVKVGPTAGLLRQALSAIRITALQ